MEWRNGYARSAEPEGGGRLINRKNTARRGICNLRAGATAATCALLICTATIGAACATECAATHSAQSWSACAVAWKCAACAIPLSSTSATHKVPSTKVQLERGLEKNERTLWLRL